MCQHCHLHTAIGEEMHSIKSYLPPDRTAVSTSVCLLREVNRAHAGTHLISSCGGSPDLWACLVSELVSSWRSLCFAFT